MVERVDQETLLHDLSQMGSHGRAEGEDLAQLKATFYPVPEHARALNADVVLVVGPRGSGKTELFRAILDGNLLDAIARTTPQLRLPQGESRWLKAYPIGRDFPTSRSLTRYFDENTSRRQAGLELWFTYLVRVLWNDLDPRGQAVTIRVQEAQGGDWPACLTAFLEVEDEALLALDRLDERLERDGKYIFVGYDELDTLGSPSRQTMASAVSGLVEFWSTYTRRWRRIRSKIFLRTDLYQRYARVGGADLAKLSANRTEMTWTDRHLYGMLVKRLANASDRLEAYCRSARVSLVDDADFGILPKLAVAEDAKVVVQKMIGVYMGANFKKGLTWRWLLEHVRDGRRQALPRPLVRLIERAADLQGASGRVPAAPRLLEPLQLRRALDTVSEEHVRACIDEWPWLEGLRGRLESQQIPWYRPSLEKNLEKTWTDSWTDQGESSPPSDSPRELVDYLIEIGIFRSRTDGRIDVPDLFLAGLRLKRKGGVRKK